MNEIQIIDILKKKIKSPISLGVNDDVVFDKKNSLVLSIDTYNEKIHYFTFQKPQKIIKKIVRSSISDIISKGIDPKYMVISFSGTKKDFTKNNLKLILESLKEEEKKFNFRLVGGDTTNSINSSFTICTFSYSKKIIKRNNCFNNDDIYITGNLGDSSVGISLIKKKIKTNIKLKNYFIDKYFLPNLAYGFHRELFKFANSSMDVSDGLLIDLKKMIDSEKQGFIVYFNILPTSIHFKRLCKQKKICGFDYLFNGDDYQILFTAKKKFRKLIYRCAKKWNQKITRIGIIRNVRGNYFKIDDNIRKITDYRGYIHKFS